jgi:hypothetical protein
MNFFDVTFAVRMNLTINSEKDSVGFEDIVEKLYNDYGQIVEIELSSFIEGMQIGTLEIIKMDAEPELDN